MEKIVFELGESPSRKMANLMEQCIAHLRLKPQVIIIDEVNYLISRCKIVETLRDVHDLTGAPVVLIGMQEAKTKLGKYRHLYDRLSEIVEFKPFSKEDYRFSLIDNDFNIYLNDEIITSDELNDLVDDTQIFWMINDLKTDPLAIKLMNKDSKNINIGSDFNIELPVKGFIASVKKPSDMKMRGAIGEKLTIDLFVNGRMRKKDILRHVSINRIYENYLYGQVHFDDLDDEKDRFTSSREGIKADDDKFILLLDALKNSILPKMADEWDKIRLGLREEGDTDNPRKTPKQRKAQSLYNEVVKDYTEDNASGITQPNTNTNDSEDNIHNSNDGNNGNGDATTITLTTAITMIITTITPMQL